MRLIRDGMGWLSLILFGAGILCLRFQSKGLVYKVLGFIAFALGGFFGGVGLVVMLIAHPFVDLYNSLQ